MMKPDKNRNSSPRLLGRLVTFFCSLRGHDWTSAAMEGLPPTDEQVANGIDGFYDYATMYCRRCGHVSELSRSRRI